VNLDASYNIHKATDLCHDVNVAAVYSLLLSVDCMWPKVCYSNNNDDDDDDDDDDDVNNNNNNNNNNDNSSGIYMHVCTVMRMSIYALH
jgi:hypothetical protein